MSERKNKCNFHHCGNRTMVHPACMGLQEQFIRAQVKVHLVRHWRANIYKDTIKTSIIFRLSDHHQGEAELLA